MTSMPVTPPAGAPVVRQVRASYAQELRWGGSAFGAVNRVYRLRGALSVDALRAAFATVTDRHEALRCGFRYDGALMMRVHRQVPPPLCCVEAPGAERAERQAWLAAWLGEEVTRGFERGRPPLMRATLVRLDSQEHALVLVIDHIISDGWSIDLLARELGVAYRAAIGEDVSLPADVRQYPDWVVLERAALTEEHLAARSAFWRERFPGGPEDVAVPLSGYRPAPEPGDGTAGIIDVPLDPELTDALRRAARNLGVTLYVLTATALVLLLQEDCGQERITLSTSSASRFNPETATMIGYLATTIWVPTTLGRARDLPAAVLAFQRDLIEVLARSDVPARLAFQRLWGPQARALMDRVPQVGFLCTPFWGESLALPGVEVDASELDDGGADAAFSVYLFDRRSSIDVQARFMPDVLEDGYARRLLDGYVATLARAARRFG
jgi:hypothetical protein